MSDADIEIVRTAYERLRTGGVEAVLEFFDPDFAGEAPPDLAVEPQTYHGHEGVRQWFSSFYEAVDDVRVEPDEFIDGGDGRVIVPGRIVVRGHDSGIEVAQSVVQVWTMRNGLAVRMEAFPDLNAALASGAGPAQ